LSIIFYACFNDTFILRFLQSDSRLQLSLFSLASAAKVFPPFFSRTCTLSSQGKHLGDVMTTNFAWQDLYQAALLELDPETLRQRIREADVAIQRRSAELERNDSSCREELLAISDAARGLRVLSTAECPTQAGSSFGDFFTREVAS
jgi:hypothetical protein